MNLNLFGLDFLRLSQGFNKNLEYLKDTMIRENIIGPHVSKFLFNRYIQNGVTYILEILYIDYFEAQLHTWHFWCGSVCLFVYTLVPKQILVMTVFPELYDL